MNEQELRDAFAQLPPLKKTDDHNPWERHRREIRRHVTKDSLEHFTSWPTIVATMYVGETRYIDKERRELMTNFDPYRLERAVRKIQFDGEVPTNTLNQLYHLHQWERRSGEKVEELDTIVEFGGGYGTMCAVVRRLGFVGEYCIYDLPELSLLQQYYLSNIDIPCGEKNYFHWVEDLVFPTHCDDDIDLLIGCYSLSEVSVVLRESFFDATFPYHCLIVYQNVFMGEDLPKYFSHFAWERGEYFWTSKTHPYRRMSYYLVGRRML